MGNSFDFEKQLKKVCSEKEFKELETICFEKVECLAQEGNAKAQFHLACWYFTGEYVKKNIDRAKYWFEQAARQGNGDALEILRIWNEKED